LPELKKHVAILLLIVIISQCHGLHEPASNHDTISTQSEFGLRTISVSCAPGTVEGSGEVSGEHQECNDAVNEPTASSMSVPLSYAFMFVASFVDSGTLLEVLELVSSYFEVGQHRKA